MIFICFYVISRDKLLEKKKQAKTAKSDKKGKPGGPLLPIDELSYGDQPQSDNSGSVNGKDRNGSNSPKNLTKTSGKGQHSESPKIWDHSTQATMRYASSPLVDELELYGHLSRKNKVRFSGFFAEGFQLLIFQKKNNNSGELIEIGSNGTSIPSTPRGESRRKANDEKVSRKRERGEINQLFSPSIANLQVETPFVIFLGLLCAFLCHNIGCLLCLKVVELGLKDDQLVECRINKKDFYESEE